jgi:sensor histidine kinase YesM
MEVGGIYEFYFKRNLKEYIVFGEVLSMLNKKIRLKIYDTPSSYLSEWDEIVIKEEDIIKVLNTSSIDYSEIPSHLN